MQTALEKKRKKFRDLYELLFTEYRIPVHRISEKLAVWSVARLLEEAKRQQVIIGPEGRIFSFRNTPEYVYLFNAEDSDTAFDEYSNDPTVIYNAQIAGLRDTLVFSREKIDIKGDIRVQGPRSDYYASFAPDQSFEQALIKGLKKIEAFSPRSYSPRKYIKNHSDETVKWNENDEKLYNYFKYDLRKKVGPLIKEQHISNDIIYHFLETVEERCTIWTAYFPESYLNYMPYLYMFETDHEDFIIEVFSELPTTTISFKVADVLFLYVYATREYIWEEPKIRRELSLSSLEKELLNSGAAKRKTRSIIERSWGKTT